MAAADVGHRVEIGEIGDLAGVGRCETGSLWVAVDCDDAMTELADVLDRPTLVAPGADEQDHAQRVPSVLAHVAGEPSRR